MHVTGELTIVCESDEGYANALLQVAGQDTLSPVSSDEGARTIVLEVDLSDLPEPTPPTEE